eukprot:scaffold165206_cov17-Tisochrysis_lutea.AAC.2
MYGIATCTSTHNAGAATLAHVRRQQARQTRQANSCSADAAAFLHCARAHQHSVPHRPGATNKQSLNIAPGGNQRSTPHRRGAKNDTKLEH